LIDYSKAEDRMTTDWKTMSKYWKDWKYWSADATVVPTIVTARRLLYGPLRCFLCGKLTHDFQGGIVESSTEPPHIACTECAKTLDEALSKILNKLLLKKLRDNRLP